jgi:acyl-CoA thioester hydrolase
MKESGYAFPVIEISAKYLKPLHYRDNVRIKAILMEYENRLMIRYEIRNTQTGLLTTKGYSTQMAFDFRSNESCFVCPQILADKVEAITGRKKP